MGVNPILGTTGCYNGQADCRMSASVMGHKWMIQKKEDGKHTVASFGNRMVGYVFNETMTRTKWGKCSWIWDGATNNRRNRGCGKGGDGGSCTKGQGSSAWFNQCASGKTTHTCTDEDPDIVFAKCNTAGGETVVPPTHGNEPQCYFPGPALNFHGQEDWSPVPDMTFEMAEARVEKQVDRKDPVDTEKSLSELNNEVVLDEELLLPDLWKDPVAAIPAFVCFEHDKVSKINVKKMRDEYCKHYQCSIKGGGVVPIVAIDQDKNVNDEGPFIAFDEVTA